MLVILYIQGKKLPKKNNITSGSKVKGLETEENISDETKWKPQNHISDQISNLQKKIAQN